MPRFVQVRLVLCALGLMLGLGPAEAAAEQGVKAPPIPSQPSGPFRGVYFNPKVTTGDPSYSWLWFYPKHRDQVRAVLRELVSEARINLVDIFVSIPYSLKQPAKTPPADRPVEEWVDTRYWDNTATFVDDCFAEGISVEIDLASNMWIPYSVDPKHQIANSGYWPMPGEDPAKPSAAWYRESIKYIESHATHPEAIALWCMMGNHEWGSAEPCLWERDDQPAILRETEKFVKQVWPIFRAAGRRPKAPPIMLPIFSTNSYWSARSPQARLSGFQNLKRWIVDDLHMPPDYWVMTSYPMCDPAPDGFHYFREIIKILGPDSAARLISTDFKGPGHEDIADCTLGILGRPGPDLLRWQLDKCAEYHFAGWWIWSYQDAPADRSGIRDLAGNWRTNLTRIIRSY